MLCAENANMALRCLYYICEQFRKDIEAKRLYRNKRILLPAPEFHVFYNESPRGQAEGADRMAAFM